MHAASSAAVVFSSGLEDSTGWGIVDNGDTTSQFGFDYSAFGIPAAPNGTGTVGLRLASNVTAADPGGGSAVAAVSTQTFSGKYTVQFDFWLNYHINGSTEEGGGAVGFGSGGAPLSGTGLLVNTEGDSATDYKLLNAGVVLGIDSGMYAIPSLNAQDPLNTAVQTAFPSQTAPAAQGTGYSNPDGTFSFAWHTMVIDVDSDAGSANFSIDGFEFGTVTGADLSGGGVALIQTDPFGSVAGDANLAFGVFDNVLVTQVPEPSTAILLSLGAGVVAFRRRRQ